MADPESYTLARRALLDALEGLGPHKHAVILCGAQAIYLHTGEGDFALAPYTTDADLALRPDRLVGPPALIEAMKTAGFVATQQPGVYRKLGADVGQVDLLVPESLGGSGRRAARLSPPHGNRAARKVRGLEAVIVDNSEMMVSALEADDTRRIRIAVAGPGGLLVAKLHKIADRVGQGSRADDKDAYDVFRLLRHVDIKVLTESVSRLRANELSRQVTIEAIGFFRDYFSRPEEAGVVMAARATELVGGSAEVAASCVALAEELLESLDQ